MAITIAGAPPAPVQRPRVLVVAAGFASVATAMYFLSLLGVYLAMRSQTIRNGNDWIPSDNAPPLTQPNIMMFTLLISIVTMQWAVWAIKNDDRVNTYLALGVTLLFGVSFVNMAAYLYSVMGFDISSKSAVAVLIYAITGSHVVMIIAAMVFVGLMAFRALGGQFTSRQHDGISAAALFWHTNVFVFFLIYLVIYITK
jgi:heme/copper-type cytochrome/quinol oxidase subunit 3